MPLSSLVLLPFLLLSVSSLRVTKHSPCEDVCGQRLTNTTGSEIVCRDDQLNVTESGKRFEDCVSCELESEYFDEISSESDVKWGLYNLRYAFSSCIYGFPSVKQSLSTPCQVTCDPLKEALKSDLKNPTGVNSYDFCGKGTFPDNVITKCAECYSLTEDEKILANYMEAIREGCHSKVPLGKPFIIEPDRVFDTSLLPPTTASVSPDSENGGKKKNLVLIIVLPIVGFLILVACLGVGCFFLVRRRRRRAQEHNADHLHERWNDTSIITPIQGGLQKFWGETPPPQQQQQPGYQEYNPQMGQHGGNYYGQQDVKHPESYMMEEMSHPDDIKEIRKPANVAMNVPVLSSPPPPRKSLSSA